MEVFYILWLLVLNYFVVDASSRVEREASCPKISDFPGRVKYRRKGTRAVFRCPKNFDLYGKKRANCLDDGTWSDEPPLCIKAGCIPFDPSSVNNLEMDVVNGALVKFSCLQNYILIGETMSYCNGKDWSAPLPRCAAPHELTECDFEQDLCGWTQDDSEEQDWIRQVGPTATGNTGPKFDHTLGDTGSGHYMFFETSSPTMTGHQANLLSPVYTENLSPMCFEFWYHILGPDEVGHVGTLEIYILDQSQFFDDDNIEPVFMKEGNQGDMWHRGELTIDKQVEPYQIAVVARKGLSYISDIAIDDVRLLNCSEQTSPESTKTTTKPANTIIRSTPEVYTITPTGKKSNLSTVLSTVTATKLSFKSTSKAAKISPVTKSVPLTTTLKTTRQSISKASSTTMLPSDKKTPIGENLSSLSTNQSLNKTRSVQTEQLLGTSSPTKFVTTTTAITSTEKIAAVQSVSPRASKTHQGNTTLEYIVPTTLVTRQSEQIIQRTKYSSQHRQGSTIPKTNTTNMSETDHLETSSSSSLVTRTQTVAKSSNKSYLTSIKQTVAKQLSMVSRIVSTTKCTSLKSQAPVSATTRTLTFTSSSSPSETSVNVSTYRPNEKLTGSRGAENVDTRTGQQPTFSQTYTANLKNRSGTVTPKSTLAHTSSVNNATYTTHAIIIVPTSRAEQMLQQHYRTSTILPMLLIAVTEQTL